VEAVRVDRIVMEVLRPGRDSTDVVAVRVLDMPAVAGFAT